MTNDNIPDNVISFVKNRKDSAPGVPAVPDEIYANVYVKGDLVGLAVKEGEILLTPQQTIELCAVLISAMRIAINNPDIKE